MKVRSKGPFWGSGQEERLPSAIIGIPHKILMHHEVNDLVPMVLHELGHEGAFGLSKAAYLVDNPDFDCLRGLAGFSCDECTKHKQDVWQDPQVFADDMKEAQFHQYLTTFYDKSLPRDAESQLDGKTLKALGQSLGMSNPAYFFWNMRHGNYGVLLFQDNSTYLAHHRELLHNFAALLSLC